MYQSIDRKILRQTLDSQKVYHAENAEVASAKWTQKGVFCSKLSCTPMVIFTGHPDKIADLEQRKDHQDLIKTIERLPVARLQPKVGILSKLWNQTKQLSAQSVEVMLDASDKAREASEPYLEKAKELGDKALEASKPLIDKAKEVGKGAVEKAGEIAQEAKKKADEILKKEQ